MFYVTAHVVFSEHRAQVGVNAFCHVIPGDVPDGEPISTAMDRIGGAEDSRVVGCVVELPLGGNLVRSYMDLLFSKEEDLAALLEEVAKQVSGKAHADSIEGSFSGVGGYRYARHREDSPLETFGRLRDAAMLALTSTPSPIQLIVEGTENGTSYRLAPESLERLRRIHGPDWKGMSLQVSEDVKHDFSLLKKEPLLPHIIEVVTGLQRRSLESLGGISLKASSGELIEEWAAASWMPKGD